MKLTAASPTRAARLSLATGVLVLVLKLVAWRLTDSVALYSDALESIVNIAAAFAALVALSFAARPADDDHPFGHTKAEYFSAVLEGVLIVVAAIAIVHEAWLRLRAPAALDDIGIGVAISVLATALNGAVALYLIRLGRARRSPALRADGIHLASDVVTTLGVLIGIGLAVVTGWWWLDPALALAVAVNVVWAGWRLIRDSLSALMDEGVPNSERDALEALLARPRPGVVEIHDLRTRRAGTATFIQFHLIVPSSMPVAEAHRLCDDLEAEVHALVDAANVLIHVEPETEAEGLGILFSSQAKKGPGG